MGFVALVIHSHIVKINNGQKAIQQLHTIALLYIVKASSITSFFFLHDYLVVSFFV